MKAKNFRQLILLITMALLTAACGGQKKQNSGGNYPFTPGCPGCTNLQSRGLLASALNYRVVNDADVEIGLNLYATSAGTGFNAATYTGPVLADGYIYVRMAQFSGCPVVPPGYYRFQTVNSSGYFWPDRTANPWNLSNLSVRGVSNTLGTQQFAVDLTFEYAELRDLFAPVEGADGLPYYHTFYGQVRLATPMNPVGCYRGPVTLFFPWSLQ